jgi:hypothetical protein
MTRDFVENIQMNKIFGEQSFQMVGVENERREQGILKGEVSLYR